MKLLDWPRQSGKTTYLINKAKRECTPVLVHNRSWARTLREKYNYPYIYSCPDTELSGGSVLYFKFRFSAWFVDELGLCAKPDWMQISLATTTDRDIEREMHTVAEDGTL